MFRTVFLQNTEMSQWFGRGKGGVFALKQEPQNSGLLELLNLRLERLLFFSFFSLSLFLNVFSFSLSSPLRRFFTQPVCVSSLDV